MNTTLKNTLKETLPKPVWELLRRSRRKLLASRETPAPTSRQTVWREWSIGIYKGKSPLLLQPADDVVNPVLTADQVTDVPAQFVADPFMINVGQRWHMFFEVWNRQNNKGEIGLATSDDTKSWTYQRIVLAEPFHLSYPHVFAWNGEYYMVPESRWANSVRLYKAIDFPWRWSFLQTLLDGNFGDSSLFHAGDRWWLFAGGAGTPPYRADTLHLFHADSPTGRWREHPESPVVRSNAHIARPAGRVVVQANRILRYAQDCVGGYGLRVRALQILQLTTSHYRQCELPESPILQPTGVGWNASGMHHVDPHPLGADIWLASVDGQVAHENEGTRG